MGKFLSYYKGQVGLFVADIACSLAVAGIDLAFPQILRTCTRGIFGEGADAIMGALVYLPLAWCSCTWCALAAATLCASGATSWALAWRAACARTSLTPTSA